ncbi:MAG TPA: ribosomal RNA small subunit methyltransferase A [Spirochaetes bacterium]|nr:ribosomal RNA small subunit methyltransferase A [Spirochaetota bacterium]
MIEVDHIKKVFSPAFISEILKDRNLSLKKRYGQNFLINRALAEKILKHADLNKSDTVLEIGPGLGTLTFLMSEKAKQIEAVEIDCGFSKYLQEIVEKAGVGTRNIKIINKDFLQIDSDDLISSEEPCKVISNFPYSAGIKTILKIVDDFKSVERIIGTVQKELADRLMAKPGSKNYAFVSVYLQYVSRIRILEKNISPGNFFPSPEVISSLIEIKRVKGDLPVDPEAFKMVVKSGFANRRKNLVNNLKLSSIKIDKEELIKLIRDRFRDVKIRAESLSVEDFVALTGDIQPFM